MIFFAAFFSREQQDRWITTLDNCAGRFRERKNDAGNNTVGFNQRSRKKESRQMLSAGFEFLVCTVKMTEKTAAYTSTPCGVAKVPPRRAFMSSSTRSVPKAPGSYFRIFSFSRAASMSLRASSSILPGSSSK